MFSQHVANNSIHPTQNTVTDILTNRFIETLNCSEIKRLRNKGSNHKLILKIEMKSHLVERFDGRRAIIFTSSW